MPRIYKGNDTTLRLLIHTCTYEGTISDLKISLYTNDPSIAIEFTDRYTIDGNIVSLDIPNWAFGSMEDGVINYVAQGMIGDDTFLTNRQSNYYLKTPTNFTPIPMPEDVVLGELTTMIVENGVFEYTPTDVDAWNKATIEVTVPQEGGSCNLGEGEIYLTANDAGFYELYAADDGYDGWSKFYVTLEGVGAIKVRKASYLLDVFNNGEQIDYGAYYYVGGQITEIQEINIEFGNATYILDNGFKIYRGDWIDGSNFYEENQIKVGAYIVVYGIIQDYNGQLQFKAHSQVIAYQECEGDTPTPEPIQSGWGLVGYFNNWGGSPDIPFEEEGEWNGIKYKCIRGFYAEGGEFKIRLDNSWSDSYTANFYNEPQFALLRRGDWNMEIYEGVWDFYLFFDVNGTPYEMLIIESGADLYSISYEYNLTIDTNVTDAIIGITSDYDGTYNEFVNSVNLPMKYGNAYGIYIRCAGYSDVYDSILCYGDEYRHYELEEAPDTPEGGDCNIQNQKRVELNGTWEVFRPDEGYDGVYELVVEADRKAEEWREEGRYDVRTKLQSIDITENGRYSNDEAIYIESLRYNGGYHTDTIFTYDINRIEVTFKADTSEAINGQGRPFILGGSLYGAEDVYGTDNACARAIQYSYGRIVGYWEGKWTDATSVMDGEWLTITLDENGMTIKYPTGEFYMEYTHDNGHTNIGADIFPFIIGGLGERAVSENGVYTASLIEDSQFRGLIREVKINTNSMGEITYIPKNWGYGVWDRKVENTGEYLSALEPTEGEITMDGEWERKYGEGWREINVNIPTIQDSAKDYYYCPLILGDTGFGEAAKSWNTDMVTFNNYDGDIIDDKLYIPTFGNKNEFRTKEKARVVQRLPNDVDNLGSIEFGDGVEYVQISETKQFTNLTDLTIGPDMNTVNFGPSALPKLRRIWCFSETDNIDVYFSMGSSFYDTGTLYLKNHNQETEWRTSLPSGWTIVLL